MSEQERGRHAAPETQQPVTTPNMDAMIGGLVASVLAVLVAFNVPLTETQVTALLGLTSAAVAFGMFVWTKLHTVEFTKRGNVFRGKANEGTTKEFVRPLGELPSSSLTHTKENQ